MRRHRIIALTSMAVTILLLPSACRDEVPTAIALGVSNPAVTGSRSTVAEASEVSDVILGCVNNGSGTIKIVASSEACTTNETVVAWGIEGPAGPSGPSGPAGAAGATNVQVFSVQTSGASGRVFCPAGMKVTGGGATSTVPSVPLIQNHPIDHTGVNATGTHIAGWQGATVNWSAPVQVFVICASP